MKLNTACKSRCSGALWIALLLCGASLVVVSSARSQRAGGGGGSLVTGGPPDNPHDLSGVWDKPGASKNPAFAGGGGSWITHEEPQMTAWGKEQFDRNRGGVKDPKAFGNQDIDPSRWCYPPGPARIMSGPQVWEIRQLPDVTMILFERDHWIRRIFTDGRGHPPGFPITWMGHSTGKWDGDTFVADTVFINPTTWLDTAGHPQSDGMHLIERFRRVSSKNMQLETTFDDPKAYTKPWTEKKTFELMPKGYDVMEHVECEEWLHVGGSVEKGQPKPL